MPASNLFSTLILIISSYGCKVKFSQGKFPPYTHRTTNQIDLKLFFPKFLVESWLDTSCLKCNYTVINNFPPLFSVSTIPLPCGQWKFPPFIRLDSLSLRKTLCSWHHCLRRDKSSEISLPLTQRLGPGLDNEACSWGTSCHPSTSPRCARPGLGNTCPSVTNFEHPHKSPRASALCRC